MNRRIGSRVVRRLVVATMCVLPVQGFAGNVNTVDIVNGAVTTPKIADGAVTTAKLGIVCPDGQYLKYTVGSGWVCDVGTPGLQGPQGVKGDTGLQGPVGPMPRYSNVAVVAKSGGNYTDPIAAMSDLNTWCGAPSVANPCLLKIMPGVYDIGANTIFLKSYVDIEGSGENTTKIVGNVSSGGDVGVVVGSDNSEIRFITIENTCNPGGTCVAMLNVPTGSNGNSATKITNVTVKACSPGVSASSCWGILADPGSPTLTNVTAIASGDGGNVAISLDDASNVTLSNVTATAYGGTWNTGLQTQYYCGNIMNVTATASGNNASQNTGSIFNGGSCHIKVNNLITSATGGDTSKGLMLIISPEATLSLVDVIATATDATNNYAIHNMWPVVNSGTISNIRASATGGSISYGVFNEASGFTIDHSSILGTTNSIYNTSSMFIGASKLHGGPIANSGAIKCINVFNGSYDPLTCQ